MSPLFPGMLIQITFKKNLSMLNVPFSENIEDIPVRRRDFQYLSHNKVVSSSVVRGLGGCCSRKYIYEFIKFGTKIILISHSFSIKGKYLPA